MHDINPGNDRPSTPGHASRKMVTASSMDWIKTENLTSDEDGPLMIRPALDGVNLMSWAERNKGFIEETLLKRGGILFRDFSFEQVDQFEPFAQLISPQLLEYRERSSPRQLVQGNIYTSTEYPASERIFLHNENSYQQTWPLKVFFFCVTPAQSGGETPIADTRRILRALGPETIAGFRAKQCCYVRNFDERLGLPWQTVFQTEDRAVVEEYCRKAEISVEWKDQGRLRISSVRPAITVHPRTGEPIWFNHVAFFHISTLEPALREGLLATVGEEELPANTYYGDGSPIEPAVLDEIRQAYERAAYPVPWKKGDALVLDNMLMAHGRAPYVGPRKILVALAEPFGWSSADVPML